MLNREFVRNGLILVGVILLGSIIVDAQATSPLEVRASVIERKSGRGDADLDALHLTIGLTIANAGNETILLYASGIDINHVWISKTFDDFEAHNFEQSSSISNIVAGEFNVRKWA